MRELTKTRSDVTINNKIKGCETMAFEDTIRNVKNVYKAMFVQTVERLGKERQVARIANIRPKLLLVQNAPQ